MEGPRPLSDRRTRAEALSRSLSPCGLEVSERVQLHILLGALLCVRPPTPWVASEDGRFGGAGGEEVVGW